MEVNMNQYGNFYFSPRSCLEIFESTRKNGPMSGQARFYSEDWTKEKRQADLLARRIALGESHGFDGQKIFVAAQKNAKSQDLYPDGKHILLTEEMLSGETDYWNYDIPADIVVVRSDGPRVVMAYPVADCPVVIMEDQRQKVAALAHCGAEYIDRHLPEQIADALLKECGTRDEDLAVYVSACADQKHYDYNCYPKWATDPAWESNIVEKKANDELIYLINLRGMILNQLTGRNIEREQIYFNPADTISDPDYYSNNAAFKGDATKGGRQLVGAFYR